MPRTWRRAAGKTAAPASALLLVAALAACSSGEDATPPSSSATASVPSSASASATGSATGSPTASPTPSVKTIAISVNGRKVTPTPARVKVAPGETLRLVVTADHDDELHAHGFDVEQELKAGVPTTVDLATDEPGLYEVETHHPALRLLQVQVG